jgi:tryptophan halogenase
MKAQAQVRDILVVGGGTAGWMTATYLATQLRATGGRVTLVESPTVPIIGVGEATVPPLVGYLRVLGISEEKFMRDAHATYKLGIKFINWHQGNDTFWHPFGPVGGTIDGMQLFHFWLKSLQEGRAEGPYASYSMQALLGDQLKSPRPFSASSPLYDRGQYAYHLDAHAFAKFLKGEGVRRGTRHIIDDVTEIATDEGGMISHVMTRGHGALTADLYIDCTGFQGMLIERTLGDGWVDWSNVLLCDRALAVPLPHAQDSDLHPYTKSTALSAGWAWQIPLSTRVGNGYVYSSKFISDDAAADEFARHLKVNPAEFQPRPLRMRVGRRQNFWRGNCVAVGLSSGFVEPLESTGIFVIQRSLALLMTYFPDSGFDPRLVRRYNERMAATYDEIRDFILLHYVLTKRSDSAFWKEYPQIALPDALAGMLDLYRATGHVEPVEHAMFPEPSWYSILTGHHQLPQSYNRGADLSDFSKVRHILDEIRRGNAELAERMPSHRDFIEQLNGGMTKEPRTALVEGFVPGASTGI